MKKILIAAMLIAGPAFAAENAAAAKAEGAIKTVVAQFDTCIAKKDWNCLGDLLTDDATLVWPMAGAKVIKGKAPITKAIAGVMSGPSMKGGGQKHVIQNVRWIGQEHALVDYSAERADPKAPGSADGGQQTWHATALMALKGGKWLIEDVRTYILEPLRSPAPVQAVALTHPVAPTQPAQPTAPAQPVAPAQPDGPPKT